MPLSVRVTTTPVVPPDGTGTSTIFVWPTANAVLSSARTVNTCSCATVGDLRQTSFPLALRQTNVTPLMVRSRPLTLHGAPAVIAGAAPEAWPPVSSQAKEATVAERNARREDLFINAKD
jgi:hypothetical protein